MTLRDLIVGAETALPPVAAAGLPAGDVDVEITALAYRSDAVVPGALFFCVPGYTRDGHDFAADAVERGAAALVCERPLSLGVPELVVPSVRFAMAPLAASFYGDPTDELRVIGVTGTNGKTTTTFFVREILEAAGIRTGLLGTVESVVGGQVEEVERTTPEAIDLQRTFRRMLDAGDAACVMEVSSHALELHRVDAVHFDCAVFTNLSQDHLDFHGTLEDYFGAKRSLFVGPARPRPRAPVVNSDDEWGGRLAGELAEGGVTSVVTFALEDDGADFRATDMVFEPTGARFVCHGPSEQATVALPVPGLFNVLNALGAIAASCSVGVSLERAAAALGSAGPVPGRFEPVNAGQGFTVLVDYAHTPEALENVLQAARELLGRDGTGGRLVCVFGAGGDRDRDKRPLMGAAARRHADHVIVTSDNPRSEEPGAIIAAIVDGAERAAEGGERSTLEVEPDRRAAISKAVGLAQAGDVVVIAGKGHEQGQELAGGEKVPFDDREVAREELLAHGKGRHVT